MQLNPVQKAEILRELESVRPYLSDANAQSALNYVSEYIQSLPVQRRCDECDHLGSDHFCLKWDQPIPVEHRETGCDAWDSLTPF